MDLHLQIGNFKVGYSREKGSRAHMISVDSWEEEDGRPVPFNQQIAPGVAYRRSVWVHACVSTITDAVQAIEVETLEQDRDGKLQVAPDSPIKSLLDKPNPFMDGSELMENTAGYLELFGNAYWEIEFDEQGDPVAIYPLVSPRVRIVPDPANYIKGYIYDIGGKTVAFTPDEIIHFKYWSPEDEYYGLAPFMSTAETYQTDSFAQRWNMMFFKNDATPGGVLQTDMDLTPEQADEARTSFDQIHRGQNKARKLAVLSNGTKYFPTTPAIKDMMFPELRDKNGEGICAGFKVPPGMVGLLKHAAYSNYAQQERIFWMNCMIPKLRKIGKKITHSLVPLFQMKGRHVVRFKTSSIEALGESAKDKAARQAIQIKGRIKTSNEVREENGDPPKDNGDELYDPKPAPMLPPPDNGDAGKLLVLPPPRRMKEKALLAACVNPHVKAKSSHFDAERQMHLLYSPTKKLFGDLAAELMGFMKQENAFDRLRKFAEATDGGDLPRERASDRDFVETLLNQFDWAGKQASRIREDFADPYRKLYERAARLAAKKIRQASGKALSFAGHAKQFELVNSQILDALDDRAGFWVNQSLGEAYGAMKSSIEAEYFGAFRQKTNVQLLADIQQAMRYDSLYKAVRTAATETQITAQESQRAMYKRAGVRLHKWWHSGNPNGRETHIDLDGVTKNIAEGELFEVGQYTAKGPGDPGLGAEELIHCDCDTAPEIASDSEYQPPEFIWRGD